MARFLKLRHGPEQAKDRWRCSYSILRSWAWATSSSKAQAKLIAVVEQGRRQLEVQMAQERAEAQDRRTRGQERPPGWDR